MSDFDILKSEAFTSDMRISKIRGCTDSRNVLIGMTLILSGSETNKTLVLETLGHEIGKGGRRCSDLNITPGDDIKAIEITQSISAKFPTRVVKFFAVT